MSNENKKNGRKAKARGQPRPAEPKRRRRLPVQATLRLDDSLPANEHHPLAGSAPEVRAASRVRVIACVLVRLARTDLAREA